MYPFNYLPAPLTTGEFYVLFALSSRESHAYHLISQVMTDSLGSARIGRGTLYPLLMRLHEEGFVELVGERPAGASGKLRMHYGITEEGLIRIKEELTRLRHIVKMGEASGMFDEETPLDIQKLLLDIKSQGRSDQ